MRVIRTIVGMLMLTMGLPALLVGAGLWAVMQHRDAGGAFSGALHRVTTPGYAIVVDDLDALLREDAPFTRVGGTRLRLTATTPDGPAFIGIAPAAKAAGYLAGVPRAIVHDVNIGTGTLPVTTRRVEGTQAPVTPPGTETFWTRVGAGALDWSPADLSDGPYSLVIMNRAAKPGLSLDATAELRPRWLNTSAWALLMLGSLLAMGGLIVLGWPVRRREIVYVVEPSQVSQLMKTIGAPIQLGRAGGRHAAANRPRTLADAQSKATATARPQLNWPPVKSASTSAASGSPASSTVALAAPSPAVSSAGDAAAPALSVSVSPASTSALAAAVSPTSASPLGVLPGSAGVGSAAPGPTAVGSAAPVSTEVGSAASTSAAAALASGLAAASGGAPPDAPFGRAAGERPGRRRAGAPPTSDGPIFEASAVEAWVAETAPARARETAARAAAAQAAAFGEQAGVLSDTAGGLSEQAGGLSEMASGPADDQTGTKEQPSAAQASSAAAVSSGVAQAGQADSAATTAPTRPTVPSPARPAEPPRPQPAEPSAPASSAASRQADPKRSAVKGSADSRPDSRRGRAPARQAQPSAQLKQPAGRLDEPEASASPKTGPGGTATEAAIVEAVSNRRTTAVANTAGAAAIADLADATASAESADATPSADSADGPASPDPAVAEASVESAAGAEASAGSAAGAKASAEPVAGAEVSADLTGAKTGLEVVQSGALATSTVMASSDDPDAKLAGSVPVSKTDQADRRARPAAKSVPVKLAKASAGKANDAPRKAGAEKADAAGADAAVKAEQAAAAGAGAGDAEHAGAARTDASADAAAAADVDVEVTSTDDPAPRSDQAADTGKSAAEDEATPAGADRLVPSARQSGYQEEVAELLAGAARRKRRGASASGLSAAAPTSQESPAGLPRSPRSGSTKSQAKN